MREYIHTDNLHQLRKCALAAFPLPVGKLTVPTDGFLGIHFCKLSLLEFFASPRNMYLYRVSALLL